jgi:chemotaxis response regulator CheB
MSIPAPAVEASAAARGLWERQGVSVVGVASTRAEALRYFEELRPDVTLVGGSVTLEEGDHR